MLNLQLKLLKGIMMKNRKRARSRSVAYYTEKKVATFDNKRGYLILENEWNLHPQRGWRNRALSREYVQEITAELQAEIDAL